MRLSVVRDVEQRQGIYLDLSGKKPVMGFYGLVYRQSVLVVYLSHSFTATSDDRD